MLSLAISLSIFGFNLTGGLPSNLQSLPVKPLQHGKKTLSEKGLFDTINLHSLLEVNMNKSYTVTQIIPRNKLHNILHNLLFFHNMIERVN